MGALRRYTPQLLPILWVRMQCLMLQCSKVGARVGLHLVEVAGFAPSPFEAEFGRHIALAFPLAEFDDLQRRLVANGATLIEPERVTPFVRFFFRDPNGYVFEVVDAGRVPEV